jgi:hypothetical protein
MATYWIIILGHLLITSPLHAQGQYSYCAQFSDGTSPDCGFSTLQMCEQSVTGVGGVCINNPYGSPSASAQNQNVYNASAVPPPPIAQPSGQAALSAPSPPPPCNPVIDGTYCASAANSPTTAPQSPSGMAPIQSVASDLGIGGDSPATLGAITFSGSGTCIGLFRRMSCGGS